MLKERIKFIWKIISLIPEYLLCIISQSITQLPDNDKKILFYLNDERLFRDNDNSGREAFQMMKTFSDGGGYSVYFYRSQSLMDFYRLCKYGRLIYRIKNLKFIHKLPSNTKNFIYAFDSIQPDFLQRSWKKLVYLNIEKSPSFQAGNVIPIPFCMHPYIYISRADEHIVKYRTSKRKLRIFFGGNLSQEYYNDSVFKQRYPDQLTRLEAVEVLLKSGLNVSLVSNPKDLQWYLDAPKHLNQMIIFKTDHTFPVPPHQWLKTLSHCDFFMCFSGTSYPMCHNVIEAMSVGSIPILSYSDWFTPSLEHGKNAIIYKDQADLIQKISEIFAMGPSAIEALRRGVLNYYDAYLTEEYLVLKYERESQRISTLIRFPLFVLTDQDRQEGEIFSANLKAQLPSLFPSFSSTTVETASAS
jgi:hypothetical protein